MTLTFVVRNQTLLYIDTKVIPRIGSAKYLELKFKFITKDWTNLRKTLHISAGEYSEPFVLQSDTFQVPTYYTQQSAFSITLLGDSDDGVVVPTNEVSVALDESNTLWTAVPPDPQNSAYLELLKSVVPSDWNQNDPTAKDYIKNRTHWVETTQKRYRDEALEFGDSTSVFFESPPWEMVVGQEYSVTWDGVAYVSECKSVSAYGSTFVYIGNSAIGYGGAPFAQNTGEPFCFTSASVYSDSAGKHSVDISYTMVITHKIDPKYLTDVESALTEQSRRVLGTDFSKFVTTTDKLYVRSQEVTQLIRTNSSSYDVLDSRTHDMFLITTPDGKTYKETIGSVELRLRTESGLKAVIPKKADGTNVTSDDLPLGCALLGLTWSDGLVLLNPRSTAKS
nr:MAG TPA: hypothetical protein [Caudoviricetes sp.]